MRGAAILALSIVLSGCPYVPDGEMRVVGGHFPIQPGKTLSLACYCDPLFGDWELLAGLGHCGASWMVQDVPGGNATFGTIDECGTYIAPLAKPPEAPFVSTYDGPWGYTVIDGCGCGIRLPLDAYPPE